MLLFHSKIIEFIRSCSAIDESVRVSNKDSEYEFHHSNGDAYAMLIYEKIQIPLDVLETVAIENLESVASDVKVLSREIIQLGDKPVLSIQCEGTITNIPIMYHAYLSTGEQGTLQFITGISKYSFDEYQHDCLTLLRGLSLAGYESSEAIDNVNNVDFGAFRQSSLKLSSSISLAPFFFQKITL